MLFRAFCLSFGCGVSEKAETALTSALGKATLKAKRRFEEETHMANKITLKDKNYRIIGYVEVKDNGDKTLKDANYRIKGYYDARANVTKDSNYRIVAHCDVLTSLL